VLISIGSSCYGPRVEGAGSRPKIRWIVALVGMLVVPISGLVWAAVGGGGGASSTDETIEAEDGADDEAADEGGTGKPAKKPKKKKKPKKATTTSRAGARKATHDAAPCCEALRAAGNEDPDVSNRPTYLAAASACESAPTAKRALTAVRSIVEGSRHELPSECKADE
jgi:hypothetical protein